MSYFYISRFAMKPCRVRRDCCVPRLLCVTVTLLYVSKVQKQNEKRNIETGESETKSEETQFRAEGLRLLKRRAGVTQQT